LHHLICIWGWKWLLGFYSDGTMETVEHSNCKDEKNDNSEMQELNEEEKNENGNSCDGMG
jgi:hypothetical protein